MRRDRIIKSILNENPKEFGTGMSIIIKRKELNWVLFYLVVRTRLERCDLRVMSPTRLPTAPPPRYCTANIQRFFELTSINRCFIEKLSFHPQYQYVTPSVFCIIFQLEFMFCFRFPLWYLYFMLPFSSTATKQWWAMGLLFIFLEVTALEKTSIIICIPGRSCINNLCINLDEFTNLYRFQKAYSPTYTVTA